MTSTLVELREQTSKYELSRENEGLNSLQHSRPVGKASSSCTQLVRKHTWCQDEYQRNFRIGLGEYLLKIERRRRHKHHSQMSFNKRSYSIQKSLSSKDSYQHQAMETGESRTVPGGFTFLAVCWQKFKKSKWICLFWNLFTIRFHLKQN